MGKLLDIAGDVIVSGAGALLDTAFGGIQQNRIDRQNRKNLQYQKDLWDYTNAENQVKHYKNAGLNVGLMYESGGNSASTGSFGIGQSQVGKLDIAQNMMAQKQIELIDAQTDKTKAEAENLRGVDRENKATQTLDLLQGIKNKEAQEELTKMETNLKGLEFEFNFATYEERQELLYNQMKQVEKQNYILDSQGKISKEEAENIKQTVQLRLEGTILDNILKSSTNEQVKANTIKIKEETSVIYKDYLLRLRNTNINEKNNLLQDYRREVEQKLQQHGLELKETQMYLDMIFKTLGMGKNESYTEY